MTARRSGAAAVLFVLLAFAPAPLAAAVRAEPPPLVAGAATVDVALPEGTPLAGYGGLPRRALLPDILGRLPYAFWFRPAAGVHDPLRARALVLESGTRRVLWLAADLIGADPTLVAELGEILRGRGLAAASIILSASHTHSGPGAYVDSELFAFIAMDRLAPAVRGRIVDGLAQAAQQAEARRTPVRAAVGRAEVRGIAQSRLQAPLDLELGVLKLTTPAGRPVGMIWNYAIHGTALGRDNALLSGDLMADAGARIERALGAPALFVNGAVGDVSPLPRGWAGVASAGSALAAGALAAWAEAQPEPAPRLETAAERVALPSPFLSLRNCVADWIPASVTLGLAHVLPAETELLAVAIGDTAWVTIPGELQTKLGLEIKAGARDRFRHVFIAGVSNDYLGYFLAPADYRRPSYVACGSLYGERGGEIIRDGALAALRRLGPGRDRR